MSEDFIRVKTPPKAEVLYNFANEPTFPISILEFEKDEDGNTNSKINVKNHLYEKIFEQYKMDRVLLYCTIPKDLQIKFGAFSPDMQESYSLLAELKLISSLEDWVKNSKEFVEKYLSEVKK